MSIKSSIIGNLIGVDGILTRKPVVAPIILVLIILAIILYYSRKSILKKISKIKNKDKIEGVQ